MDPSNARLAIWTRLASYAGSYRHGYVDPQSLQVFCYAAILVGLNFHIDDFIATTHYSCESDQLVWNNNNKQIKFNFT